MFQEMLDGLQERRQTAELEGQTTYCSVCGLAASNYFEVDFDPLRKKLCYRCHDMVSKGFDPGTGRFGDAWFTPEGTIEFSQTLTGEQATMFEALLKIQCRRKVEDCNGPWCTARKHLMTAFGVKLIETEKPATEVDPDIA